MYRGLDRRPGPQITGTCNRAKTRKSSKKAKRDAAGAARPLIIVESPSKARTLERYLQGRYAVKASVGHVRDLPKSDFGIDEDDEYRQTYVIVPGKEKTIKDLKSAARKASQVLLGTDPDREGEAISWHLAEALGLDAPLRVEFHEITKSAVEKAWPSPGPSTRTWSTPRSRAA